eukprot:m.20116 g.20116  ORF g.20116 m.20116 type:complete len:67 (-) comp10136_c0_seq1:40-240(-)
MDEGQFRLVVTALLAILVATYVSHVTSPPKNEVIDELLYFGFDAFSPISTDEGACVPLLPPITHHR